MKISGARERIAALDQRWNEVHGPTSREEALYTRLIPIAPEEHGELNANAAFVRELSQRPDRARLTDLRPFVDQDCLGGLPEPLPASPYIVLFPGASAPGRKWPAEKFAEVARRCRTEYGWSSVVCGGAGDRTDAETIARSAGAGVLNLAGATDLSQLTAILAGAEMLISNETSAVHIAAALGVPAVCVIGGGHYGRFLPYLPEAPESRTLPALASHAMECFGCNWICKYHPARGKAMPCVEKVAFETVWHQIVHGRAAVERHFPIMV